jgi:hypothetical protein
VVAERGVRVTLGGDKEYAGNLFIILCKKVLFR